MKRLLILYVPKEPRLTEAQLQTLVDIFVGTGILLLGSAVIPGIFDTGSADMLVAGAIGSIISWFIALLISGRIYI